MKNIHRPLSPHLGIYKPQITSFTSIMHRMTGVFLYISLIVFAWWITFVFYSFFSTKVVSLGALYDYVWGRVILVACTFSLFYHLCNGIRHLFWDIGKGYEISTVNKTGIFVIFAAVVLTVVSWGMALNN